MPQNLTKFIFLLLVMPCFLTLEIRAISVSEYREKVSSASLLCESLKSFDESLTDEENLAAQRNTIKAIRQMLPAKQQIEFAGQTIEADNIWLGDKLDAFTDEKDTGKRAGILSGISTRLAALKTKLAEIENAEKSSVYKNENRRKLQEILNRPEYQKPEVQKESLIQKIIRQIREWFAKLFPDAKIDPSVSPDTPQAMGSAVRILILLFVLGIVGFLVYRFAPVLLAKYELRDKGEKKERVVLGETILADETPQNLFGEAEALARNGDLRAAIRKGYIALLCELSDRKIIGLARHKTNRDYLRDIRSRQNLFEKMRGLTAEYERHWYGFDAAEKSDWEAFKKQYELVAGEKG